MDFDGDGLEIVFYLTVFVLIVVLAYALLVYVIIPIVTYIVIPALALTAGAGVVIGGGTAIRNYIYAYVSTMRVREERRG
ncbi:MAG: hypothetical protein ACOX21_00470 [Bacillota bacterium]|jgi:hypothetical protein